MLVVTKGAARQLDVILDYIAKHSPGGAKRVQARILDVFRLLRQHPMAGETTRRPGVRRMVTTPYPYVVFYRVEGSTVIIQRVRHAARRPIP